MNAAEQLNDFKDWVSPIIVKELRQGMRTRLFTTSFIVLQGFMVLFVMIGFAEGGGQNSGSSAFFWFLISITLLLVMPLRGFGALSSEIRLNTMDLIALTRMSSWRITAGKWAALVSQTALLTVGVLPYVVLRYFFGGINPISELFFLAMVLILSCVLSAAMVGLSAFPNFLVRALLAIGASIGAVSMSFGFGQLTTGNIEFQSAEFRWGILAFLSISAFLTFYFLAMGATRIATEADNYSLPKRFISILALGIFMSIPAIVPSTDGEPFYVLGVFFVAFFALDALTETPSGVRSLHVAFTRRGPLGNLFQFIFTPGWFSGIFYVLILAAIHGVAGVLYGASEFSWDQTQALTVGVAFAGSLLFPLLIIHLFMAETRNLFASYFFVQAASVAVGFCLLAIQQELPSIMWAGSPIPFVNYLMSIELSPNTSDSFLLVLALVTLGITLAVCLWRGAPIIAQMNQFRVEHERQTRPVESANAAES